MISLGLKAPGVEVRGFGFRVLEEGAGKTRDPVAPLQVRVCTLYSHWQLPHQWLMIRIIPSLILNTVAIGGDGDGGAGAGAGLLQLE